jgi:hypothetical protein
VTTKVKDAVRHASMSLWNCLLIDEMVNEEKKDQ